MVVTDGEIDKGRKLLTTAKKPLFDILHEPVGPILVRNIHVEDGKTKVGVVEQDLRHGNVRHFARASGTFVFVLHDSGKLESLTVVAERDSIAAEMLPHGPGFRVVLG